MEKVLSKRTRILWGCIILTVASVGCTFLYFHLKGRFQLKDPRVENINNAENEIPNVKNSGEGKKKDKNEVDEKGAGSIEHAVVDGDDIKKQNLNNLESRLESSVQESQNDETKDECNLVGLDEKASIELDKNTLENQKISTEEKESGVEPLESEKKTLLDDLKTEKTLNENLVNIESISEPNPQKEENSAEPKSQYEIVENSKDFLNLEQKIEAPFSEKTTKTESENDKNNSESLVEEKKEEAEKTLKKENFSQENDENIKAVGSGTDNTVESLDLTENQQETSLEQKDGESLSDISIIDVEISEKDEKLDEEEIKEEHKLENVSGSKTGDKLLEPLQTNKTESVQDQAAEKPLMEENAENKSEKEEKTLNAELSNGQSSISENDSEKSTKSDQEFEMVDNEMTRQRNSDIGSNSEDENKDGTLKSHSEITQPQEKGNSVGFIGSDNSNKDSQNVYDEPEIISDSKFKTINDNLTQKDVTSNLTTTGNEQDQLEAFNKDSQKNVDEKTITINEENLDLPNLNEIQPKDSLSDMEKGSIINSEEVSTNEKVLEPSSEFDKKDPSEISTINEKIKESELTGGDDREKGDKKIQITTL